MLPCMLAPSGAWAWIGNHASAVEAITAVISAFLASALVVTTVIYAHITHRILEESRKARLAAEGQASAARRSVELLREQIEDQAGLGRSLVQTAMESAVSSIEYWKKQDIAGCARFGAMPPTDGLVPVKADSAVEHARRMNPEVAQHLSSAFDNLRMAKNEVESMKGVERDRGYASGFFKKTEADIKKLLDAAFEHLEKAQELILAGTPGSSRGGG